VQDLWEECYTGQHRKVSPGEFKNTFCANCMNAGCKNSKGSGMSWVKRIMTQEDTLLNNPKFADPSDPRFRHLVDFQDKLREALAIEVATQRGDWEVPTSREIGQAAAELVGISPTGYQAAPPEKLVDDVKMTGLDGKPVEEEPPPKEPDSAQADSWKVLGSQGQTWVVTREEGSWSCTCPAGQHGKPCKHIQKIRDRVSLAEPEALSTTHGSAWRGNAPIPKVEPPQDPVRPPVASPRGVSALNTEQPRGGVMIGNAAPPPPPEDPWAPKKPKEKIIPLGGKISFKK